MEGCFGVPPLQFSPNHKPPMQIHPEIKRYLDGEIESIMCRAFLRCENPATTTITHPIYEQVPACDRCADRMKQWMKKVHE